MANHILSYGLRAVGFSLLAATALAGSSPADAQYSVDVRSAGSAGTIYDAGSVDCHFSSGAGGACSSGTAHYGGVANGSVTPNGSDPNATRASASVNASGGGAAATAASSADLATASLHLFGTDSGVTPYVSSAELPHGSTSNYAAFTDVLHFAVSGASSTSVTPFTLVFGLDGTMRSSQNDASSGEIFGQMTFGGSDARFDLRNNASTGFQTAVGYLDTYPSNAPGVWTTNADHSVNTYTQTFSILGSSQDFAVALFGNLECSTGMACDYGNTARLHLQLPTGTSFTSDSGAFLTTETPPPPPPVGGAVPEPSTWAMMLIGFGGVGLSMRRRVKVGPPISCA